MLWVFLIFVAIDILTALILWAVFNHVLAIVFGTVMLGCTAICFVLDWKENR